MVITNLGTIQFAVVLSTVLIENLKFCCLCKTLLRSCLSDRGAALLYDRQMTLEHLVPLHQ